MKNKRLIWIIVLVVVLAAAAGGFYYYRTQTTKAAQSTQQASLQTTVARQGDLTIQASATGQIVPVSQISIGFDDTGTIIDVPVQVGQQVKAGDLLARLQTKNTPEQIAASIASAQQQVLTAQKALDDLNANAATLRATAMNDITTYAQAVRDAQYNEDQFTVPTDLAKMDAVEGLDWAKKQLDQARTAFEPYKFLSSGNQTRLTLLTNLDLAQSTYDSAVRRLNLEYLLSVAEANLAKARQDYDKYKDGAAKDDLALAQSQLDSAKANLAQAQQVKAIDELRAPSDGTILSIAATVGQPVGSNASSMITLADLKQPLLQVYLDETDLENVAPGYPAQVTFDAFPDRTFAGKVVSVDPSLQTVSNVAAVMAQVALDIDPKNPLPALPVGLNASVDIIAKQAKNAVLIPPSALRVLDPGEYAVFVMDNTGQLTLRPVQVGLQNAATVEITSGLKPGEIVSTGLVATR
jgi:HlyD family secretion protein